jgi:hypothetical protein
MTETPAITVLLAAVPGPLRDALQALLLSLAQVHEVAIAGDPEAVMNTIETKPPGLVVLVMDIHSGWSNLPNRVRAAVPASRIAALIDDEGDVKVDSVDLLLQQGTRPDLFVGALVSLLNGAAE